MYASNDGGYQPPDGANPNSVELEGVTIIGKRPSWLQRQWAKLRGWVGDLDRSIQGNHRDVFERKLENPDGGGIVFTSNRLTGGNEQRIGGKNADQRFVNVDDMSFFGGGYSPIGTPGFGGKINDFTNALDRGHQLFDKYTNHGGYNNPDTPLWMVDDNDSIFIRTVPKDSVPYYKEVLQRNGIIYSPGVYEQ